MNYVKSYEISSFKISFFVEVCLENRDLTFSLLKLHIILTWPVPTHSVVRFDCDLISKFSLFVDPD